MDVFYHGVYRGVFVIEYVVGLGGYPVFIGLERVDG